MNRKFKYVSDGTSPKDATTMDELFGVKKKAVLPFSSLPQLEASIKRMNMAEIQTLAIQMGIKPCSERVRLVRACIDQYNRLTKTYGAAKTPDLESQPTFDPSKF